MNQLLINLSILFAQPTGIGNYASNLVPYLESLNPTLLTAQKYPQFKCYSIPDNLTPAQGTKGHFRRLVWTQFDLPKFIKNCDRVFSFLPSQKHLYTPTVVLS